MKKPLIILLIVAAALIFTGGAISISAFFLTTKGDISILNTENYVEKTFEIPDKFDSVNISDASADIVIKKADEEKCTVVYCGSERFNVEVGVKNDTLTISRRDERKWYERIGFFFNWKAEKIILYIPEGEYRDLSVKTLSSDIEIPENFSFESANVKSTSGDIVFLADVKKTLNVISVSGDIAISGVSSESIKASATSGDIEIASCKADDISLSSTSGDIIIEGVDALSLTSSITSGNIDVTETEFKDGEFSTVSGDVIFADCSADSMKIKAVSGDVGGTLKNEMRFITSTVSGSVRVPDSESDNICEVKTTSGSIHFKTEK